MKIIFGDDGFRSRYQKKYMSDKFLKIFSYTLNNFLKKESKFKLAIGYDTRFSNKEVFDKITDFIKKNIKIYNYEVISLGQLSYELKNKKYDYGIMITASHFHHSYNGIKILDHNGEKINRRIEKSL